MKIFYKMMMLLGMIGTGWILYLLWSYAPNWTWWFSIPAWIAVKFGAFAQRDMWNEYGG